MIPNMAKRLLIRNFVNYYCHLTNIEKLFLPLTTHFLLTWERQHIATDYILAKYKHFLIQHLIHQKHYFMQKHQQKVFLRDIFAPRQTSNFACPRFAKLLLVVAMMVVPWVTQGQSFNYSCNFDSDSDTAGWVFVNGSQSNQWAIGTATNNSGTKSMYVSNDNGVSNSYTNSSTTFCYAYREVTLDAGNYVLTYD